MVNWTSGTIRAEYAAEDIAGDDCAIWVDTAGSWEGSFPDIAEGDFIATIGTVNGDRAVVVSRRYTSAISNRDAAEIAMSAVTEIEGFDTDDNGDPLPVEIEGETGIPVWIVRVDRVTGSIDDTDTDTEIEADEQA